MSLTSGKSVYLTANEFSTDDEFDGDSAKDSLDSGNTSAEASLKDEVVDSVVVTPTEAGFAKALQTQNHQTRAKELGYPEGDTASSTLEDDSSVGSVMSSKEYNENEDSSDEEDNVSEEVEIQEDVLKLCNEIAEAQQPDFQKQDEIERACFENLIHLRTLAISEGGLLANTLRKRAWPLLLGISPLDLDDQQNYRVPKYFPRVTTKIQELVQLDVNRVLKRFPPNLSETQQDHIQSYLNNLILAVLQSNPQAHYYQGFHDICLTFLLVCLAQNVPYIAYMSLNKMVETTLAPFMEKTMEATNEIIHVVFAILEKEDKALYNKIVVESKCPAAFCLPWVITWFSHTLPNDTDIFRLSDFILGCGDQLNPSYLIPVFLSAALVLRNSDEIKENVTDTDIATMHHTLAQLPLHETSLEPWLKDSLKLIKKYAGKEKQLMARAIKIKDYMNELWNEEPVRRRRPVNRNGSVIATVGRFVFIRHRWLTLAIVVLGAAFFAQRYGGVEFEESTE
ncbi:unnamed protein product [Allacma fusca]|uniref:Rab-GAP TBC domain-containing protein n=1 Tax=Allacma fusca TaxID=39272 RepID=A0A8J2KKR1_9HEXA|nr:unnamed protein product [Allacma fusca]